MPIPKSAPLVPNLAPILAPNSVRLSPDGESLRWLPWDEAGVSKYRLVTPSPRLFDDFRQLADPSKSPANILRFAKQYGVLGLCKHALPLSHKFTMERLRRHTSAGAKTIFRPLPRCEPTFAEPISTWRALARSINAMLELNHDPRRADLWSDASWLSRQRRSWHGSGALGKLSSKELLSQCLNEWLACGGMHPRMDAGLMGYQFISQTGFPNLFGTLALVLASKLMHGERVMFCHKCGNEIRPAIPNASLSRHYYCAVCRGANSDAARADAQRRYRAKLREKKKARLYAKAS